MSPSFINFIFWILAVIGFPKAFYEKYRKTNENKYLNYAIYSFDLFFLAGIYFFIVLPFENAYLQQPQIEIAIWPLDDPCLSKVEFPKHDYSISILNKNKNSAQVQNFNIEFFFPSEVVDALLEGSVDTGGPFRTWNFSECHRMPDGTIDHEAHIGNQRTENAKLEPLREGSSIALFKCGSWPIGDIFSGRITIDLNRKPRFIDRPDDIGIFRASYEYKIGDQIYRGKNITGKIPKPDTAQSEAEIFFNQGLRFFNQNDCQNAINNYTQALEKYPDHEYALMQRGLCYGKIGEFKLLNEDFSRYIKLRPNDPFGYYYRAISWKLSNNYDQAQKDFFKSYQLGNKEALKEYLHLKLRDVDPMEGSIALNMNNGNWLKVSNEIYTVIPEFRNNSFALYAFVDEKSVFRVYISNSFSKNCELSFSDFKWLINKPNHPKHIIRIEWGENKNKLYLDNALVDLQASMEKEQEYDEDPEAYSFNMLKNADASKGEIDLSIGDPELSAITGERAEILPHVYRNGIELNIYKDTDNKIKVLISNKYANGIILEFDKVRDLPLLPTHPNHSMRISWSDGKCRLYVDDILSDIYPSGQDPIRQTDESSGKAE